MAWFYLLIASLFEVGWPTGLKMAALSSSKPGWVVFAVIAMVFSSLFLYFAQKDIPIGTAYAIWTGIGASCTFVLGVLLFQDSFNVGRCLGICFIVTGVVFLKYAH